MKVPIPTKNIRARAGLIAALCFSISAVAQTPLEGVPEKLGSVDFPVSCSAAAQGHMTLGAACAAELGGDRAKARLHYTALAKLLESADAGRPEVRQAIAYLARN